MHLHVSTWTPSPTLILMVEGMLTQIALTKHQVRPYDRMARQ